MAPTEILAEQHFLNISTAAAVVAVPHRAADRQRDRRGAAEDAGRRPGRDDPSGRRHARARRRRRPLQAARARRHRRAASLRRAPAREPPHEGPAPRRARDDGDADSEDAGADAVWRPRRLGHPRHAARTGAHEDQREARIAPRGRVCVRARAARRGPAGVCDLPARRGVGEGRPEGRHGHVRSPLAGRVPAVSCRAPARPDEGRRQGSRDEGVRGGRDPDARLDDRRRGRRRRGERERDARRARRAVRPLAAPPAPRPRRSRPASVVLRAPVSGAVVRRGARAAASDDGDDRRIRDRRARSLACAVPATSSARARPACRRFARSISFAIARSSRRPGAKSTHG